MTDKPALHAEGIRRITYAIGCDDWAPMTDEGALHRHLTLERTFAAFHIEESDRDAAHAEMAKRIAWWHRPERKPATNAEALRDALEGLLSDVEAIADSYGDERPFEESVTAARKALEG